MTTETTAPLKIDAKAFASVIATYAARAETFDIVTAALAATRGVTLAEDKATALLAKAGLEPKAGCYTRLLGVLVYGATVNTAKTEADGIAKTEGVKSNGTVVLNAVIKEMLGGLDLAPAVARVRKAVLAKVLTPHNAAIAMIVKAASLQEEASRKLAFKDKELDARVKAAIALLVGLGEPSSTPASAPVADPSEI